VTIVSSGQPTTFKIGGVDTRVDELPHNGNPCPSHSRPRSGVTNTSGLVGQFTLPPGTPQLTLAKSGPATMNLGETGDFRLDAQNTGVFSAFNATLLDRLPKGPTGGIATRRRRS